ncbi:MAG: NACHT domain-containing protein [bacterium]|nr:NACHT domain-containing protein [bacterium]
MVSWPSWRRHGRHEGFDQPESDRSLAAAMPPDLQILVNDDSRRGRPPVLSFELKAREPRIALNFRGLSEVRELDQLPEEHLELLFQEIGELPTKYKTASGAEARLAALGSDLAEKLFPCDLQEILCDLRETVKTVQIQSNECWIPWEVLRISPGPGEEGVFLGEAFALTRWHRGLREHRRLPLHHIAVVVLDDSDLTRTGEERAFLESLRETGRKVKVLPARMASLRPALGSGKLDGWHFCGHGSEPRRRHRWQQARLDGYEALTPEDFSGRASGVGKAAPLFFFNACHTARTVLSLSGRGGWAQKLLDAGVGAFLGASWATTDDAALEFAKGFYSSFLRGTPIGEAVRVSRLTVREKYPGDPSWLAFAVFAHPLATCDESREEKGIDRELFFQECFALLRLLELRRDLRAGTVRIAEWPADPPQREDLEVVFEIGGEREVWITTAESRQLELHLGALQRLRQRRSGEARRNSFGSIQAAPLDPPSSRAAILFEQTLLSLDLQPDVAEQLSEEASHLRPMRGFVEALLPGSVAVDSSAGNSSVLDRFYLQGYDFAGLKIRTLRLLEEILDIQVMSGVSNEAAYSHYAGPALTLLRSCRGQSVAFGTVVATLLATASGSSVEAPKDQVDQGLMSFLASNVEILKSQVYSQSIELGQLFVRPHARLVKHDSTHFLPPIRDTYKEPMADVGRHLIPDLLLRIRQEIMESKRNFLLILGDFGHGKTTLLKYLAASLSGIHDPDSPIPVYIPLREFQPDISMRQVVEIQLRKHFPLTGKVWNEKRWLLLCDGFDEMDILHHDREDRVFLRFTMLLREAERHNVQVILTTRPTLFLEPDRKQRTIGRFDRLELLPFDKDQIRAWLEKWSICHPVIRAEDLEDRNLLEVAQTPVALLMIAMIYHQELVNGNETYTRSMIYKTFFDWTAKTGGLTGEGNTPKRLMPEKYREILPEIAWILFAHPEARGGLMNHELLLAEIRERHPGHDQEYYEQLIVGHAFHEEESSCIGFIHQSLLEYLLAEGILGTLGKNPEDRDSPIPGVPDEKLLPDKSFALETVRFFRGLIESRPVEERQTLAERHRNSHHWPVVLRQLAQKIPDRMKGYRAFRRIGAEVESRNYVPDTCMIVANLCLLGFLSDLYLSDASGEYSEAFPRYLGEIQTFLASDTGLEPLAGLLRQSLTGLTWRQMYFQEMDFRDYLLFETTIQDCPFQECSFRDTDFSGARIGGSSAEATFFGCEFKRTRFQDVRIERSRFQNCTFDQLSTTSGMELHDVVFERCRFEGSDLIADVCEEIRFLECTFVEATVGWRDTISKSEGITLSNCIRLDGECGWRAVESVRDLAL